MDLQKYHVENTAESLSNALNTILKTDQRLLDQERYKLAQITSKLHSLEKNLAFKLSKLLKIQSR